VIVLIAAEVVCDNCEKKVPCTQRIAINAPSIPHVILNPKLSQGMSYVEHGWHLPRMVYICDECAENRGFEKCRNGHFTECLEDCEQCKREKGMW
jgi:hypothetical protein